MFLMAKKKTLRPEKLKSNDWDKILDEVEKKEIPVDLIDSVVIHLISGHSIIVDVDALLKAGNDSLLIEQSLNEKLQSLSDIIRDVDFHIKKDKVIKAVAPFTTNILKNLDD